MHAIHFALPICLCLVGCSAPAEPAMAAADAGFAATPLTTLTSNGGGLTIAVRTAPDQPPTRGTSIVELTVQSTNNATPVDGLSIAATPFMPAMGHGSSVVPTVVVNGSGVYVVQNVSLYMPGRWELRTSISGAADDAITIPFDIE